MHETGLITTYLREILENAKRCQSIGINDYCVRPWGKATLERETQSRASWSWSSLQSINSRRNEYDFRALRSIMDALSRSNTAITTFSLVPARPSRALQLHGSPTYEARLTQSRWMCGLTTLYFQMFVSSPSFRVEHVTEFINRLPQLQNLTLVCLPWEIHLWEGSFDAGIYQQLHEFVILSGQMRVRCLRCLRLERFKSLSSSLIAIFEAHRATLREISLHAVAMISRTSVSWQSILEVLRDRLEISKLHMHHCSVARDVRYFSNHGLYHGGRGIFFQNISGESHIFEVVVHGAGSLNRAIEGLRVGNLPKSHLITIS